MTTPARLISEHLLGKTKTLLEKITSYGNLGIAGLISRNACIDSKGYFDGTGALLSVNSKKSAAHTQLIFKDAGGNIMMKKRSI